MSPQTVVLPMRPVAWILNQTALWGAVSVGSENLNGEKARETYSVPGR